MRRARVAPEGAIGAAVAVLALTPLGAGWTANATGETRSVTVEARAVAVEFFLSQNERRYDDTCRLLSDGFIASHALRDRRTCAAVMRVEFAWNRRIDFHIDKVTNELDRVVVRAIADGSPGRLVLVRESGALRILAVQGG